MAKEIKKIVLTGGPCAGKTTACSWIQNNFVKQGYKVIFVPEVATELINAGVGVNSMHSSVEFQTYVTRMMLEKEKFYLDAIENMDGEKFLVIFDRGILDNLAYMDNDGFLQVLKNNNLNYVDALERYDAVFHLVTAANGAEDYYNLDNETRSESIEEARILDEKTLNAWIGHSHLRVIDNSCDFNEKMQKVVNGIANCLGVPYPYEIERKFLIKKPDLDYLKSLPNCNMVHIEQVYLESEDGVEERVRKRGVDGNYIYTKTKKINIDGLKRIEIEESISEKEFEELLKRRKKDYGPIEKDRYCLMHNEIYFEIDVYPFMNDKAIIEVELNNPDEEITFPPFVDYYEEVTFDSSFKNGSLA